MSAHIHVGSIAWGNIHVGWRGVSVHIHVGSNALVTFTWGGVAIDDIHVGLAFVPARIHVGWRGCRPTFTWGRLHGVHSRWVVFRSVTFTWGSGCTGLSFGLEHSR